jgi:hypothetical protein
VTDQGTATQPAATAPPSSSRPIDELRAEARYHRQRYALYQAKVYSSRPTTTGRLRELESASREAQERLTRASR